MSQPQTPWQSRLVNQSTDFPSGGSDNASSSQMVKISFHPETFRICNYLGFVFLTAACILITKYFVKMNLKESHIHKMFGFNNVCVYFDYEPARTVGFMMFSLVLLPLVLYFFFDFMRIHIAYEHHYVSKKFYNFVCVIFPIQVVLVCWFPLVFVHSAEGNFMAHFAGFIGMIVALSLVSIENLIYLRAINKLPGPFWLACVYVGAVLFVSITEIVGVSLVGFGILPKPTPVMRILMQAVDVSWFILVTLIPIGIASVIRKTTPPLEFYYHLNKPLK